MKIAVMGLGYVGLSNAALLAQHHEVVGVDLDAARVAAVNAGQSPIQDPELADFLARDDLTLSASTDAATALKDADVVIVATIHGSRKTTDVCVDVRTGMMRGT